jgi:hypothetical protein
LRNSEGGIRTGDFEMYKHDDNIFNDIFNNDWSGGLIVVLDNGMGDHIVFKYILDKLRLYYKDITIALCYPELFEGENVISIEEAKKKIDIDRLNVYGYMANVNWTDELKDAYWRLYANNSICR